MCEYDPILFPYGDDHWNYDAFDAAAIAWFKEHVRPHPRTQEILWCLDLVSQRYGVDVEYASHAALFASALEVPCLPDGSVPTGVDALPVELPEDIVQILRGYTSRRAFRAAHLSGEERWAALQLYTVTRSWLRSKWPAGWVVAEVHDILHLEAFVRSTDEVLCGLRDLRQMGEDGACE